MVVVAVQYYNRRAWLGIDDDVTLQSGQLVKNMIDISIQLHVL